METYSWFADALQTWRVMSDWVKAMAILSLPGGLIAGLWVVLDHRRAMKRLRAVSDAHVRSVVAPELSRAVRAVEQRWYERLAQEDESQRRIADKPVRSALRKAPDGPWQRSARTWTNSGCLSRQAIDFARQDDFPGGCLSTQAGLAA